MIEKSKPGTIVNPNGGGAGHDGKEFHDHIVWWNNKISIDLKENYHNKRDSNPKCKVVHYSPEGTMVCQIINGCLDLRQIDAQLINLTGETSK